MHWLVRGRLNDKLLTTDYRNGVVRKTFFSSATRQRNSRPIISTVFLGEKFPTRGTVAEGNSALRIQLRKGFPMGLVSGLVGIVGDLLHLLLGGL